MSICEPNTGDPVTVEDIRDAAKALRGIHFHTPILENEHLNERVGGRILIKPETLQRTGSFKFRGAFTKINRLTAADRKKGVVAFSSGNHAQGVACAARQFGIRATIVMPDDAPAIKIERTRDYGANVILYDRAREDRAEIAAKLAADEGAILVPPYDDTDIIAGQGTVGLEIVQDLNEYGIEIDALLSPVGGGGLIAGISTAVKAYLPATEIWGVEPEQFDDTCRSLEAGKRLANRPGGNSICDAIVTEQPGKITFEINRRLLAGGLRVSDRSVIDAIAVALDHMKLVVEPGGCVALAAVLSNVFPLDGRTIVTVLSGGNIDQNMLAGFLASSGSASDHD
ncbi:MAG: threonine/serine dehydratase [Rhizobiaceae bacterium]